MGPHRLNSLLNNFHSVEDINLRDAANDWSSKGGQPTIVLDCLNFARKFYDPNETGGSDVVCNGEYKKIAENMRTLIRAFKDVSIRLEFFLDGPVDETKLGSWIDRRKKKLMRYSSTFNRIESTNLSMLKEDAFPCMILPVMKEVLKEENICIVRGVDDHDKEMAKYVVDKKCLGIFSDDTDFVVFDGIPNVFSARRNCLIIETMKTKVYRRQKFLEATKLKAEAMPIFATLLGNDYIEKADALAYSVRKFKSEYLNHQNVKDLANLANRIYDESNTMESRAERVASEMNQDSTVVLKSLRSYDLNISNLDHTTATGNLPWDSVVTLCHEKFMEGFIENQTLSIVKRQLCTQSEKFEDPKNSHVDALGGIRQRIYSILLHEKPSSGDNVTVTEIIAGGANSMKRVSVPVLKVEADHPGILKLWNSGEEMNEKRWALIWWALRSKNEVETVIPFEALSTLRRLPDHLMIVGLVLLYLEKVVKGINEKEKEVLMVLATSVPQMSVAQLSNNGVERTKKRAANLATLYMQTYVYVRWVMDVCGLRLKAKTRDAYSGQLFHYLFQLDDPEEFFEQSGEEARKKYLELRKILDLAKPSIPSRQSTPMENSVSPASSDQNADTKQEGVDADRKERKREEKREERRATDSRRDRESPDQRRDRRRQDWHDDQRRNREDTVWKQRHQGERDRNYRPRYGSNQPRRGFNRGRWEQNNRYRGSDRPRMAGAYDYNGPRRAQNYRRDRRDFSRNSRDRRSYH